MSTHASATAARTRPPGHPVVAAVLLAPLLALACDGRLDPAVAGVSVATDRTSYVAAPATPAFGPRYQVGVRVRIENASSRDVVLATCGGSGSLIFDVEMPDPAQRSAYAPVWACPASTGRVLRRGQVLEQGVLLSGPNQVADGAPVGALEGAMRLVYHLHPSGDEGRVRSGSFTVALPAH